MHTDLTTEWQAAGIGCRAGVRLADVTTFRLGGPCRLLVSCRTPEEVVRVVTALIRERIPYLLIGGGSNLLVADEGVDRVVVRYVADMPDIREEGGAVQVTGGTSLDELARFAVERGLGEMVNASGIPGTVGGAIQGNAGAYGWQIGDAVETVWLLTPEGRVRTATAGDIRFSYRDSGLKASGDIVLSATLRLPPGDRAALAAEREQILASRREKHPDIAVDCCAGSFFRNVEPTSKASRRQAAGWFLEQVGAKEMRVGGARVYPKHANIIVKGDASCRAGDILALSRQMAGAVKAAFGFDLVREVQVVGKVEAG